MKAAVFLLSGAILAHQVCLLRVLAIATWSHAAALVVSVALLGFGAAGTLLALAPGLKRPATVAVCCALYAAAGLASLRAGAAVAFDIRQVGWDAGEWLRLLLLEGVFLVPFLAGGLGIAVALALTARRAGPTYAANLLGSGAGAALAAPLLHLGPPEQVVTGLCAAAAGAAALVPWRGRWVAALAGGAAVLLLAGSSYPMARSKALAAAPEREILETRYHPLGRVDRATWRGLRHAPGLSLVARGPIPAQEALCVDGHLVAVRDLGPSGYLEETTGALPFLLGPAPRVVLLGVGPDLARADLVVEPNADLLAASGAPGVAARPRAWLQEGSERYDVILHHVAGQDPVREAPMLTVEGLARALSRVAEDGSLAVSTRLETPPRPGLRLLLTAERVTPHVLAVRSMDHLTVVLRHRPPTALEWEAIEAFCRDRNFDVVRPRERRPARPHHLTSTPLLPEAADARYDVEPCTDARPYFHRFFRWARLGDLFRVEEIRNVQWRFVAVVVAFLQVSLASVLLLLAPLLLSRAARTPAPLFLGLGLAYMLLEMGYLARATVLLGGPVPAAASVLGGFLVGSGLGSLVAERLGRPLRRAALSAALLAPLGFLLLPASAPLTALVAAGVAFPMGMPFPSALARLPGPSVPWALAVNGCASVTAAAAVPLLASSASIPAVVAGAAALYLLVAALSGRPPA